MLQRLKKLFAVKQAGCITESCPLQQIQIKNKFLGVREM